MIPTALTPSDWQVQDDRRVRCILERFRESHPPPFCKCWQVARLLECIHERLFDSGLTVQTLRRCTSVRDHNVSCRFKHEVGVSIRQYVEALRLEAAVVLLADPSISVATAAHSVGYLHLQTFYRAVARRYGCTPVSLRCHAADRLAAGGDRGSDPESAPSRADEPDFTAYERQTLEAAMERLLPQTDIAGLSDPVGAATVGTIGYIDRLHRQSAFVPYAGPMREGLLLLDSLALAVYGARFAECTDEHRDHVLSQAQLIPHVGARRFFALLMRFALDHSPDRQPVERCVRNGMMA